MNKDPITSPVYEELVAWTTEWCTGLPDDDKQIADAILMGFNSSGVSSMVQQDGIQPRYCVAVTACVAA